MRPSLSSPQRSNGLHGITHGPLPCPKPWSRRFKSGHVFPSSRARTSALIPPLTFRNDLESSMAGTTEYLRWPGFILDIGVRVRDVDEIGQSGR